MVVEKVEQRGCWMAVRWAVARAVSMATSRVALWVFGMAGSLVASMEEKLVARKAVQTGRWRAVPRGTLSVVM